MHRILPSTFFALSSLLSAQVQFQECGKHHLPDDSPLIYGSHAIAHGDVDGDGDLDVVIGDVSSHDRLYVNDGSGVFVDVSATQMPSAASASRAVTLGDVDGDGDLDLVIGNSNQQDLLYLNDGRGRFADATANRMPSDATITSAIMLADVDLDGDHDMILGSNAGTVEGRQTRLYVNDGAGNFSNETAVRLPVDAEITDTIAVADVDGDGDPDLVVGNGAEGVSQQDRLYVNDGRGRFADETAARMPVATLVTDALAFRDVDGDGDPDLYVGTQNAQDRLYLNDGEGRFTDQTLGRLPRHDDSTAAVAFADVDSDGDADVVVGTGLFGGVVTEDRLYVNDGRGAFVDVPPLQLPVTAQPTRAIVVADVDGDGDADALFARDMQRVPANELWLNDGSGAFANGSQRDFPAFEGTNAFVLVDIDGDRDLDIVAAMRLERDRLYLNDGRGSYTDVTDTRMPETRTRATAVESGDFDGDGDQDLIVGDVNGADRIYENDGDGVFTDVSAASLPPNSRRTFCLDVGDADGDGDLDIVLGSIPNNGQTRLYVNDGRGVFADLTSQRIPVDNEATNTVVFGDVDGDRDLDIVIANAVRPMQLYLNDGNGRFTDGTEGRIPRLTERRSSMVLGDVDGDRDLDIVVAVNDSSSDRLLLNDGHGVFADGSAGRMPFVPTRTYRVGLHDVDDDGDPDLVVGKQFGAASLLCVNDGTGRFTTTTRLPSADLTVFEFGDVDGDRDLDMVVWGRRILRNLRRQVVIPHLAQGGRDVRIDAYARYGPDRWADVVFPFVSDVPASIPIPPFGVLGVDPRRAVALPAMSIPRHVGSATTSFAIPDSPAIVGVTVYVQALLAQLPDSFVLTNVTEDIVLR